MPCGSPRGTDVRITARSPMRETASCSLGERLRRQARSGTRAARQKPVHSNSAKCSMHLKPRSASLNMSQAGSGTNTHELGMAYISRPDLTGLSDVADACRRGLLRPADVDHAGARREV